MCSTASAALDFKPDREIAGSAPTIGGEAAVGNFLYADARTWTPSDITFSYQWNRNGTDIPGAAGGEVPGTSGRRRDHPDCHRHRQPVLRDQRDVHVGTDGAGGGFGHRAGSRRDLGAGHRRRPADSLRRGLVPDARDPVLPVAPVRHRDSRRGRRSTYTPTADDKGKALSLRITGTKAGYTPAERTSQETAVVTTGVIPAPVQFADRIGTPNDTYTVPASEGVEYVMAGTVVPAGTYRAPAT